MRWARVAAVLITAVPGLGGCRDMPGYPRTEYVRPDRVTDFHELYSTNCAACHGKSGENGPATDLANPEYLALVDDGTLRKVIAQGMPGTEMPAWAQSAGGMLTDAQVDALIAGMRKEWGGAGAPAGATPPPYAQAEGGDEKRGQQAYQERCAGCHQGASRQQLTSPAYLSLVSNQALRTIIIAGRPDIGQPDWRHDTANGAAGQPLSAQDVTDIVTYLGSLRNSGAVSATPAAISPRR